MNKAGFFLRNNEPDNTADFPTCFLCPKHVVTRALRNKSIHTNIQIIKTPMPKHYSDSLLWLNSYILA